jgi:5,10-methylenetetrahydromethanopterin reductase
MAVFQGEVGLQFTTHLAKHYTLPQWVDLADHARRNQFDQVWINDNLGHRNIFVILAAIASKVPIKLGTAILVPYFRNPIDTADALASLSELTGGREISVGIARGDYAQAGNQIQMIKPISIVSETVRCLTSLFKGESVRYGDFPALAEFFNLRPASTMQLGFEPTSPILFYTGGNGPKIMEIAGRIMDGVLIGGFFIPLVRSGKLAGLLAGAEHGRELAGRKDRLRKICEINISVSDDREKARSFPKRYIAHMLVVLEAMGFTDEEFQALGVDRRSVTQIKQAFEAGGTIEQVSELITDQMVDIGFIAGTPSECREPLEKMCAHAQESGFDQICLSKLGPDYEQAITLLAHDLLPPIIQR